MHKLFYTDQYILPLPAGHKFPAEKYRMLRNLLEADGEFLLEPGPLASPRVVELIHDHDYVQAFIRGELAPNAIRKIGFPWSEQLVERTLASVGATLAATETALRTGWGGTLAGGTHHAFVAEGSGFCVFNDIAIAIADLSTKLSIKHAAVIDLDVHQGDGTAVIFQDDRDVFTFSMHCNANFPLRKQRSTLDVELDAGTGDEEYLSALAQALPKALAHRPDIVFYQAGVDGLASDRLGHLALTHEGLNERDRMVVNSVRDIGVPLVVTLGGGYSEPIELTAQAHANTFRTAAALMGNRVVKQVV